MTRQNEGKRVLWMVWGLVAAQLLAGAITIGLIGWTLSQIRSERARLVEEERQLVQASEKVNRLTLESREEIEALLQGGPARNTEGDVITGLREVVRQQLSSATDESSRATLTSLESSISDLEELRAQADAWRTQYTVLEEDIEQQRTLRKVRGVVHSLGAAVDTIDGRRRLQDAIQHRRWRMAKPEDAARLAQTIVTVQANRETRALRDIQSELAHVGRLVEVLAGEEQADNLSDIKDNKLKPSLDRLGRSISALSGAEDLPAELGPNAITSLDVALFGEGFSMDEAHQTVRVGQGGLYALRRDVLRLRQEREVLQGRLQSISTQIDASHDELAMSTQEHAKTLAMGVEASLTRGWQNMLLFGGFSFVGFLGVAWMISGAINRQVRALEEARSAADTANRSKSEFLANMSHELRTPLNGILGYAQILRRDATLSEKQKSGVEVIQRSGDHLLTLINDILDLSKIEAQKLELQLTEFHLSDFLQQISNIIRVRAEQAGLSFDYEHVGELPVGVRGDEKRLRQVLLNLLGNSVKFTEQGGVVLKVGFDNVEGNASRVRFQVEDTGRGIPPDKLEEIFQPFQQVSDTARHVEGTGLGLAITTKLVALMGGELGVTSTVGKGSKFWFTVDLHAVDAGQIAVTQPERSVTGYKGERRRLMVVDDKPANRGIVKNLLEPLGFEVVEAVDGSDCLTKISERRPELIFMDLVMPVMDGIETTRRIRQSPELNEIVVIASSASAFDFNRQDSLTAGCNDFLPKPVRADELFEKLRTLLGIEWVYDTEAAPAEDGKGDEAVLVAPPREEIQALADLAKKGKIMGIRGRIAKIEQLGEQYRPFAAELGRVAKSFDMDQVTKFLAPYLEEVQ